MKKRFRLKKRLRLSTGTCHLLSSLYQLTHTHTHTTGTETSLYSMLDPISMSGTRVRSLWRFVQHFEIASSGGLIAQSFALGVRDYLEAHRSEVSRLENFKTTRGLVTFRVTTTDLGRKLRSLCELCCVDKNEDEDKRMWRRLPRGAALLAHISRSIDCTSCGDSGDASIGNLFRRLFVLSFVPYAKMMDTWIRLGKISHHEDPYCEFMVQCVPRHHKHHHEEEEEEKIKSGVRHNVGNLVVVRRSEAHVPQFLGSDTVANIWTCGMLLCRMRHDNTEEYYKECTNTTTMRSTRIYFKPTLQSIVVSKSLSSVNRRLGLLRDRRELLRNDRERRVTLLSQERARVAEERRLQREAAKRRKAQESREERERKRALFARMKRDAREAMKRRKARERKEKEDDMETIRIARERGMRRVVGEPVDERLKRLAKQRIEAEFREKEAALVKKYGGVSGGGVGKKKRTGVRVTQDSGGNSVAHDIIYGDRLVAQKNSVRVLAQSGGGQSEAFDAIYGADLSNNTTSMTTSVRVLKPSGDASTMEDILTGKAPISRKNASIKVSQPSGGNTEADGVIYGTSTLDTNTKTSVKVSQPSGGNTKADGVIYGTSTLDTNTKTSVKVSQPSGGNTKADGVIYGTSTLDTNTKTSVKVSQPSGGNTKADGVIYGTSTLDTNTKTSVKVSQPSGGNTEADGVIYGTSTLDTNTKTSVKVSQPSGGKSKADGIIYGTATLDNNTKTSVKVSQPSGGNTKADGIIYGTSTLDNNTKTSVKVSQPSGGNTKADGIIYGTSTLDNNTKTSVKVSQPSGGNTKAHGIIYGTSKLETNMRTSVKVSQPSGGITTLVFGDESLMRHEEKTESDDFNLPTFESEISIFSNQQQQQQQQNSWSQDLIRTFLPGQKGTSWIIPSSTNKYRPSCSTLGHSTFWSPTTVTRDFYNKFKNEEGEEDEFLTPLRVALQQCVRDPLQMQLRVVEQAAVDIVIGPKQLESHISVLREFMLMESGLVFDLFVEEAYARTITSGRGPTPMHLNHIFETSLQRAGHSSTGPFVKRFMYKRTTSSAKMTTTMTVPKSTTTTRALLKSLNRLRATYQIESTSMLRLVITEESIRKYAQIHSALLETRCVQYSLRRLWVRLNFVLRQQEKQDNMVLARQMSSLQRVLHGFAWLELRRKLCDGSLITVKDLRLAHETFLSATARACFISENVMTSKIVRDAVSRCYDCIMRFCETVDLRRGIQLDADFQGISRSFRASTFELCASLRTYATCHGHLAHDQIKELRMALDPDFFCGV